MTVIVSILAYFWVYNYPSTAEFLSEEERQFIQFRLKNDSDATFDEKFTWSAVLDAFKDPKVWLYGLGFHTMSLPLYTLSLFLVHITCLVLNHESNTDCFSQQSSRSSDSPPPELNYFPCHRTQSHSYSQSVLQLPLKRLASAHHSSWAPLLSAVSVTSCYYHSIALVCPTWELYLRRLASIQQSPLYCPGLQTMFLVKQNAALPMLSRSQLAT